MVYICEEYRYPRSLAARGACKTVPTMYSHAGAQLSLLSRPLSLSLSLALVLVSLLPIIPPPAQVYITSRGRLHELHEESSEMGDASKVRLHEAKAYRVCHRGKPNAERRTQNAERRTQNDAVATAIHSYP